jgi:stalled ribosome alternative rescue factor ArfA
MNLMFNYIREIMRTIRHRNILAKLLHNPRYKQRIVKSKVIYNRKLKHKEEDNAKYSNNN